LYGLVINSIENTTDLVRAVDRLKTAILKAFEEFTVRPINVCPGGGKNWKSNVNSFVNYKTGKYG
jgi:hypothetical protein